MTSNVSRTVDLRGNLPALTGLRACAALWVLVYHAWVHSGPRPLGFEIGNGHFVRLTDLVSVGWAGVDVFFTLSAFLLTLPFLEDARAGRGTALGTYFKRRALRILPAYYAQLALLLVFAALAGGALPDARTLGAHLVLWLNVGSPPVAPLIGVWWTLPIEFAFYFALPLLVPLLTPRRAVALGIGAFALTLAYRAAMFAATRDLPVDNRVLMLEQLPGRLDQFVIGMLAAYVAHRLATSGRAPGPRRAAVWLGSGALALVALVYAIGAHAFEYWEGHPLLYVWHTLASLAIAALILGAAFAGPGVLRVLANPLLLWAGTVSYSLYLWHQWLIQRLHAWLFADYPGYAFPWLLGLGLVASLAVASVSYALVERPFLRTGRSGGTAPRDARPESETP